MAKFHFPLQNLLNIRMQLENQKKMEYATAQELLRRQEEELKQLQLRKDAVFEKGRLLRQTTLDFLAIRENDTAREVVEERIEKQKLRVETAREDLEEAREALRRAMQERKTLDKLRDRAFETYLEEEKAREGKEVDELVSYTYGIRRKESADGGDNGYEG